MPKANSKTTKKVATPAQKKAAKQPISTPNYCKVITDKASGIKVSIMAVPSAMVHINKCTCAVAIGAIAGNVNYVESVGFKNLNRALDYIADYGPAQAKRFAEKTLQVNAKYPERAPLSYAADSQLEEAKK